MATVTGWGYWNSTQTEPSELLKQIDVEIQSDEECIRTTTGVASKYVAGQNLCAGEIVLHNVFSNFHQEPLKGTQQAAYWSCRSTFYMLKKQYKYN